MHANDFSKDAQCRILVYITIAFRGKLKFSVKDEKRLKKSLMDAIFVKDSKYLHHFSIKAPKMQKLCFLFQKMH